MDSTLSRECFFLAESGLARGKAAGLALTTVLPLCGDQVTGNFVLHPLFHATTLFTFFGHGGMKKNKTMLLKM